MAFDDLVRSGVALANSLTGPLQAQITVERWTGAANEFGDPTFAAAVTVPALVEHKQRYRQTSAGQVVLTSAKVSILDASALPDLGGVRTDPIDLRDRVTLPDALSPAPIVDVEGLVDPDTDAPYVLELWLGSGT